MKPTKEWTEEEKRWVREGMIVVIGVFIITVFDFILIENFFRNMFNLYPGAMSLFRGIRILLVVLYVIGFLPAAPLAELADSRVKKRSFRPKNVLIFLLIFGEGIFVAVVLLTLCDMFLSEVSILDQIPLAALCVSIPSIVVALTSRIKKVREYVKKAFD